MDRFYDNDLLLEPFNLLQINPKNRSITFIIENLLYFFCKEFHCYLNHMIPNDICSKTGNNFENS